LNLIFQILTRFSSTARQFKTNPISIIALAKIYRNLIDFVIFWLSKNAREMATMANLPNYLSFIFFPSLLSAL